MFFVYEYLKHICNIFRCKMLWPVISSECNIRVTFFEVQEP